MSVHVCVGACGSAETYGDKRPSTTPMLVLVLVRVLILDTWVEGQKCLATSSVSDTNLSAQVCATRP